MGMRHMAVVAGLALGLMSGSADAELLRFSYTGSTDFSFYLSSDPTPTRFASYATVFDNLTAFDAGNDNGPLSMQFNTAVANGGFTAHFGKGDYFITTGEQIFSGTIQQPQFAPQVTPLFDEASNGAGLLTVEAVSSVPLPSSAPMFGAALLGLAGLGYAAKRKKAAAAA